MLTALHTCFRMTPSGPLHGGHFLMAGLNREAARATGGTFLVRTESLKPLTDKGRLRNHRRWWRQNFDELRAVGITPTEAEVLQTTEGLHPGMAWEVSDNIALQQHYWHELGLAHIYGEWPPTPPPEETAKPDYANNWRGVTFGNYHLGCIHPYLVFSKCVTDIATRRNCTIRGGDHKGEEAMVNAYAQLIARKMFHLDNWDDAGVYAPAQYFLPKIRRSGSRLPSELRKLGPQVLSSSNAKVIKGFRIADIVKSGQDPHMFFRLLTKALFGSEEAADQAWTHWGVAPPAIDEEQEYGPQGGVQMVFENTVPDPVVEDDEWFDLLTAEQR